MVARVVPLEPPFDPEVGEQLRQMMPAGVEPIALFRAFTKNMPMTRAMQSWGSYELGRTLSLSLREREIVIDRTCARTGCEYEWGVHVAVFADRAGLSREQIASLTHGQPADSCWRVGRERLLIEMVDSLHDSSDIPDALWAELAATFSEAELLDQMMLTGWYHAISYVARAARIGTEPGAPSFASA